MPRLIWLFRAADVLTRSLTLVAPAASTTLS
jgi:hypothetical protein